VDEREKGRDAVLALVQGVLEIADRQTTPGQLISLDQSLRGRLSRNDLIEQLLLGEHVEPLGLRLGPALTLGLLEDLRAVLNKKPMPERPKLTLLPFLMRAMVKALAEQPNLNALYDDEAGLVRQHAGIHLGIATQTPGGLMVPVVKHAEARDIFGCALELNRIAERARQGTATRDELTGSTITITSLGAMGGIATTPVINHPEVAIVGVNKMMVRPVWDGTTFVPRKMMNLSSSFDHRVVDGWDAAVFVQRLKELLENPATLFIDG
ncbi:MAG: hypothetical protein B7Z40_05595, partial [Bosea sp. 12-68-7]